MRKISFSDRLRYQFDNLMSQGTPALIGALFVVSLILIAIVSLVVVIFNITPEGGTPFTFGEAAWAGLMRTLDAGTMGGDEGWAFRVPMLVITLGGIFVVSMLIGVLTTGIESKLDEMRKGRSFVVEEGHTVILGWSTQVFAIVNELVTANANLPRSCIAILAEKDKVEMEDELHDRVGKTGKTRIVCRTGDPIDLTELDIVNPHAARAIIILAPETADADSRTIKTMLAITNNPHRHPEPYHIVAEIRDPQNLEAAQMVGKDEVELVKVDELIGRITAQTCRQSGLSVVYTELLDFGGDEIYFSDEPALAGKTFGEALLCYEDSALLGMQKKDGQTLLNPPMDTRFQPGDKIIAVSADDDTVRLSGLADYQINQKAICSQKSNGHNPERTLILGWNRRSALIIRELDNYVAPGSTITILADDEEAKVRLNCECEALINQKVTFIQGDFTNRRTLDSLDIPSFNHVITLSASDLHDAQQADARTLIALLHLRDIADKSRTPFSITSEMLDVRNRALAEVTRADDFIVSDKLISLMMSQLSENKALGPVFQDLFDPEGSELYLKPASDYVIPGEAVNFYTVIESARRRGHVAIGYRLRQQSTNPEASYGVHVNPKKSDPVTFTEDDRIIVLAED